MIRFVDRKFVIYVGKQTINGILFEKGKRPTVLSPNTLAQTITQEFFETGILNDGYIQALIDGIQSLVDVYEYGRDDISIYITSEFRITLDENDLLQLKGRIFDATQVHAFVLSDELEELYIRNLLPTCSCERMILRIMSTSTNLYHIFEDGSIKRYRIKGIGTSNILSEIPGLRKRIVRQMTEKDIAAFVQKIRNKITRVMEVDHEFLPKVKVAVYLGGEIDFLTAYEYVLDKNVLFDDDEHPYMLSEDKFAEQSCEKILKKKQSELESEDIRIPRKWQVGMKPCTLIAMALFEMMEVETIIPSNMKEFYGMHYKNFENVVITGSKRVNGDEITEMVRYFKRKGIEVYSPQINRKTENAVLDEINHLQAINKCDTLIVCNNRENGYLGDATLFDIGYAMAKGKRVITTKKPSQDVFNLMAVEIGIYGKE